MVNILEPIGAVWDRYLHFSLRTSNDCQFATALFTNSHGKQNRFR
jgi:hypothetical protein